MNSYLNFNKLAYINDFFQNLQYAYCNSDYYKSKNKTQTVKCRVCLAVCLAQNYRSHLKNKHPEENASDLRRYGEGLLAFTLKSQKSKVKYFLLS